MLHLRRLPVRRAGHGAAGHAGRARHPATDRLRLHTSYLAPRLRWLRDTAPDTFRSAHRWMSLGEYVYLRLLGTTVAGSSTAAWTGMLDRRTGQWDLELL